MISKSMTIRNTWTLSSPGAFWAWLRKSWNELRAMFYDVMKGV